MNKYLIAFLFFIISATSFAQTGKDQAITNAGPKFNFITKRAYDFGGVYQNAYVTYQFSFKNTGTTPLIIKELHSSSKGINSPAYKMVLSWTKTPIPPGQTGMIEIAVKAQNDTGAFKSFVYASSNACPTNYPLLYITGKIVHDLTEVPKTEQLIPVEFLEPIISTNSK